MAGRPTNNLPYKHGITDCVVNIADIIAVEPMAALTQNPHAMAAMANISQHYVWLAFSLFF